MVDKDEHSDESGNSSDNSQDNEKSVSKAKDESRPKRKKARRACLACQRAHLTCGDERPCLRCIKRGLQNDCQDGMRKKAKYLHDAPNEALMPGVGQKFSRSNGSATSPEVPHSNMTHTNPEVSGGDIYTQGQAPRFSGFPTGTGQAAFPPHMHDPSPFNPYVAQQPTMNGQFTSQQSSPMQDISATLQPPLDAQPYVGPYVDPNDPTLFNFDLASLNFDNRYGAMEFGMLGHISSGAANDQPAHRARSSTYEAPSLRSPGYVESANGPAKFLFNRQSSGQDWPTSPPQQKYQWTSQLRNRNAMNQMENKGEPNAYSIGAFPGNPANLAQDSNPDMFGRYSGQFMNVGGFSDTQVPKPGQIAVSATEKRIRDPPIPDEEGPKESVSKRLENLPPITNARRPRRDPSRIYSSVNKPYPYTSGFHALTAVLQRRFSSQKRLRIAQALASIRPSFISCMRTLINDDLVFMEKCFQRQLWEYEDFVSACGTPTIVCRRTGEVAYVGKEFTVLTGWRRSVLLGHELNMNINRGGDTSNPSGTLSSSSRGGVNTPTFKPELDRPQPVFLAELLDDDSVIQFYEDFAKLAFADSKGSACKPCKLLKYKTKEDPIVERFSLGDGNDNNETAVTASAKRSRPNQTKNNGTESSAADRRSSRRGGGKKGSANQEDGMHKLGDKEGKIDCMYCWTVKRDVFDIPTMIVINFLPIV